MRLHRIYLFFGVSIIRRDKETAAKFNIKGVTILLQRKHDKLQ